MAPKSLSHRSGRPLAAAGSMRWRSPLRPDLRCNPADSASPTLHWPRTLLAKGPQPLRREHLRHQSAPARPARLHMLLLDTSGSMRRHGRLALAKGHAAWLIAQAARSGDHVALLGFGGQGVQWLQHPGPARRAASERVRPLGGGGGTPLVEALACADTALRDARQRQGIAETWLWLLTDGRSPDMPAAPAWARHIVVVDHDDALSPAGRCAEWAARWGAQHMQARLHP